MRLLRRSKNCVEAQALLSRALPRGSQGRSFQVTLRTAARLPSDSGHGALSLNMPAMMLDNIKGTRFNWAFQGEAEPELDGRRLQHDRGL